MVRKYAEPTKEADSNSKEKLSKCPHVFCPLDQPTKFAHLGLRVVYTIVSWVILGKSITIAGRGFFTCLILFSAPLLFDYLKFTPDTRLREVLIFIGKIVSGFWIVTGFFGQSDIINLISNQGHVAFTVSQDFVAFKSFSLTIHCVWWAIGLSIIPLTFIDWIIHECPYEKKLQQGLSITEKRG
ncbi:MAG: hypothetical protein AB1510_04140 [Bacillota bacterium]